jgi:hypothetical protein
MKKFYFIIFLFLFSLNHSKAQNKKKIYWTYGPEVIMSFGVLDVDDITMGNIMRFSPVINLEFIGNKDFGDHFGLTFGAAVHNTGFILNYDDTTLRYKFRTYNIGIPVGFKVGNVNNYYFYAGYELEFPISYKEKKYIYMDDSMFTEWFSDRVPALNHAIYAGFNFGPGMGVKIKYYLNEFFNRDFVDSDGSMPYKNLKANVVYISFDFLLFRNNKFVYDTKQKK